MKNNWPEYWEPYLRILNSLMLTHDAKTTRKILKKSGDLPAHYILKEFFKH